jgi:uncharacterized protein YegL
MAKIKTYVALILDKSGSMQSIQKEALSNFNEQLQTLKSQSNAPEEIAKKMLLTGQQNIEGIETRVSIVTFNENIDTLFFDKNVTEVEELKSEDYQPNGMTALIDAMGSTIDQFTATYTDLNDPDVGVLFVIVTDGMENSSRKYTKEQVKSKVEELQASKKWTFTFLGANIDVWSAATQDLGILKGNTVSWSSTSMGTQAMASMQSNAIGSYYATRSTGATSVENLYDGLQDVKKEMDDEDLKKIAQEAIKRMKKTPTKSAT